MKKETLLKKYYKNRSKIVNKLNGFTTFWKEFIPNYFSKKSEMEKDSQAFPSVMGVHTVSIKINGKYTFLPANCNGEVSAFTFVRLLKENGVDIQSV